MTATAFDEALVRAAHRDFWLYYNRIDGRRVDLTDGQFTAPGALFAAPERYQDSPTIRVAALTGIPQRA